MVEEVDVQEGKRMIFREENTCDYWVGESAEALFDKVVSKYGVLPDEIVLTPLDEEEKLEMYLPEETIVDKHQIPDGGCVVCKYDEPMHILATVRQWLDHLPEEVPEPWLLGEW